MRAFFSNEDTVWDSHLTLLHKGCITCWGAHQPESGCAPERKCRQGHTYHTRHSPKNRLPYFESEPPHDYLHRRPAPLDCWGRSSAAWVLVLQGQQPCPLPCSRNSLSRRHTADLHLQKEENTTCHKTYFSNQKAGRGWNEIYPSQRAHTRQLHYRNLKARLCKNSSCIQGESCIRLP